MKYQIFTRTWWKENPKYPNGLEPSPGRKTIIDYANTEAEARDICERYNSTHDSGRLLRKAEYTSKY